MIIKAYPLPRDRVFFWISQSCCRFQELGNNEINRISGLFGAMHSVQILGGYRDHSSENRKFVLPLSKAAVAVGIAGLFCEVYENPDKTLSDSSKCVGLKYFKQILEYTKVIDSVIE